jgi:hypothetical protein
LRATISTPAGIVFGATTLRAGVDTVVLIPAGDWRVHTPDTAMPDIDVRIESGLESTVEF